MKFSFQEKGTGETIVLIHSYLWDSEMWREQIDLLSKKYHCLAIDLPSHGKENFDLKKGYSLSDLAKDVVDFIDEKGIKEFHYIGLSVGGMLAPYLYELKKDSMKSIIMMDSYSGEEGIEKHTLYFKLLDMIEEYKTIPQPMAVQIANMFFAKNNCNVENRNYFNFLNRLQNFDKTNIKNIVTLGRAIFGRDNKLDVIPKISCPLYFIVGNEDEPRLPKESLEMSKLNKNSKYIVVENAGHISNLDNAKFVNKIFSEIFKL